jgi:hypothetical protein
VVRASENRDFGFITFRNLESEYHFGRMGWRVPGVADMVVHEVTSPVEDFS